MQVLCHLRYRPMRQGFGITIAANTVPACSALLEASKVMSLFSGSLHNLVDTVVGCCMLTSG